MNHCIQKQLPEFEKPTLQFQTTQFFIHEKFNFLMYRIFDQK